MTRAGNRYVGVLLAMNGILNIPIFAHGTSQRMDHVRKEDREELGRMLTAVEAAVNDNKPEFLKPYLDKNFIGQMVSGQTVDAEGLLAYWDRVKTVGPQQKIRSYTLKFNSPDIHIAGDTAAVKVRTKEKIVLLSGETYEFHADSEAQLQKDNNGRWKLVSTAASIDMREKMSLIFEVIANKFRSSLIKMLPARQQLAAQRMPSRKQRAVEFQADRDPDYDGWRRDLRR